MAWSFAIGSQNLEFRCGEFLIRLFFTTMMTLQPSARDASMIRVRAMIDVVSPETGQSFAEYAPIFNHLTDASDLTRRVNRMFFDYFQKQTDKHLQGEGREKDLAAIVLAVRQIKEMEETEEKFTLIYDTTSRLMGYDLVEEIQALVSSDSWQGSLQFAQLCKGFVGQGQYDNAMTYALALTDKTQQSLAFTTLFTELIQRNQLDVAERLAKQIPQDQMRSIFNTRISIAIRDRAIEGYK
jgi:hypothetical protein